MRPPGADLSPGTSTRRRRPHSVRPPRRAGAVRYDARMPIVHVHVRAGRAAREKQAILDGVHAALVEAFRIPEHDRNQILHEHAPEHFESAKGPGFTLVELTVFPGRTPDAKRRLYAAIVGNLERSAGVAPADILVVLHEPPLECWGIRGGKAATDVGIGFKLDV